VLGDESGSGAPRHFKLQSQFATPNINPLAREGMRFTYALVPGALCHPLRLGLMTGRPPFRTDLCCRFNKTVATVGTPASAGSRSLTTAAAD
jgi:arylsulfatase A-like enzyme